MSCPLGVPSYTHGEEPLYLTEGKDWDFPMCGCSDCGWDSSSSPSELHSQGGKEEKLWGCDFVICWVFIFPKKLL